MNYPTCVFCGCEVSPNRPGHFRKVEGWAEVRTGGGVHGLTDRRELGEFACSPCIKMRRMGVSTDQGALL